MSQATEHIGLVATGSTTFDAPYHIARRFASLDHISGGRAGWNIVTTSNPDAALNFGLDEHMEHGERYRRAREFYDVVTGLWDSFADDAFIRDVESGIYFDPDKMHVLDHKGEFLSVRGPLNIARPVQGWPVIVQAGASEAGRQLAAETAEAVFTAQSSLEAGQAFYADVKGRAEKARPIARSPEDPARRASSWSATPSRRRARSAPSSTVSSTTRTRSPRSRSRSAMMLRSSILTVRCPRSLKPMPSKSGRERAIDLAKRENLTVRQLAQRLGGYSGLAIIGTAEDHRRRDGGMA